MTICVAALAKENNKEYIVFATDYMVTTNQGQFEHTIVKYKPINDCWVVAMLSGRALLFDELVNLEDYNSSFDIIKERIFQNFKKKKEEVIEKEVFERLMIDKDFFMDALEKKIPNEFVHNLLKSVYQFNLKTSIMLIGFDDEGIARISEINEKGFNDFREINFHAIGFGFYQA